MALFKTAKADLHVKGVGDAFPVRLAIKAPKGCVSDVIILLFSKQRPQKPTAEARGIAYGIGVLN